VIGNGRYVGRVSDAAVQRMADLTSSCRWVHRQKMMEREFNEMPEPIIEKALTPEKTKPVG